MRHSQARVEADRLTQGRFRLAVPTQLLQENAEVVVRQRQAQVDADRLPEGRFGVGVTALIAKEPAHNHMPRSILFAGLGLLSGLRLSVVACSGARACGCFVSKWGKNCRK